MRRHDRIAARRRSAARPRRRRCGREPSRTRTCPNELLFRSPSAAHSLAAFLNSVASLGVLLVLGLLVLARLGGDALAVGVLAVLVGAVELVERLALVRGGEVLVGPLCLALLGRVAQRVPALRSLLRRVHAYAAAEAVVLRLEGGPRSLRLAALGLALLDRCMPVRGGRLRHRARGYEHQGGQEPCLSRESSYPPQRPPRTEVRELSTNLDAADRVHMGGATRDRDITAQGRGPCARGACCAWPATTGSSGRSSAAARPPSRSSSSATRRRSSPSAATCSARREEAEDAVQVTFSAAYRDLQRRPRARDHAQALAVHDRAQPAACRSCAPGASCPSRAA